MKDGAYDIDIRLHRFSRFQCSGRKIKYIHKNYSNWNSTIRKFKNCVAELTQGGFVNYKYVIQFKKFPDTEKLCGATMLNWTKDGFSK